MSVGLAFFDTNILIYAEDGNSPAKQSVAQTLIYEHQRVGMSVVSLQVLQEYYSVSTVKLRMDRAVVQRKVELLARGQVVRFAEFDVIGAIELHRLSQLSFWDALIVHAARISGASTLYTEDLQHGATVSGVRIVNPFLDLAG